MSAARRTGRRRALSRTGVAAALTALAVALPTGYWFVAEGRAVASEREALLRAPEAEATAAAARIAARVDARLAALADRENARPFFHYQNLYVDPRGASEGLAVTPSPLADGNADPLVVTNFQIDGDGGLSLPSVNPDIAVLNDAAASGGSAETLVRLEDTVVPYVEALLSGADEPAAAEAPLQVAAVNRPLTEVREALERQALGLGNEGLDVAAGPLDSALARAPQAPSVQQRAQKPQLVQEQRIAAKTYVDNVQANQVYLDIQAKKGHNLAPIQPRAQVAVPVAPGDEVVVRVGPLTWHTVGDPSAPELVALRRVETPDGARIQGFEVDRAGLADLLVEDELAVALAPGAGAGPGEASLALGASPWHVSVDFAPRLAAASAAADRLDSAFAWRFGVGVALAVLAGLAVVLMIAQTERLSRRRVQFAASAAHELRTPLAGLRMYGEMLAEGLGNPDRQRTYARRVASEADRLGRVVSNVLDFTRLERGNLAVSPAPGDLGQVVREVVARLEPTLAAAGASVDLEIANELPLARFDRDAVEQVLSNLLDNAEKYSREAADRRIAVTVAGPGGLAAVVVEDRGPGVSAALERRLFEPFARGAGDDQPAGLGLGLALARVLVAAQGGALSYRRRAGGGSAFTMALPLA